MIGNHCGQGMPGEEVVDFTGETDGREMGTFL